MNRSLPRVVAIGFNKCGTRSLADLFRKAGHPVVHHKVRDRWPIPRRIGKIIRDNLAVGRPALETADHYTFYCDLIYSTPQGTFDGAGAFKEILRDYPDTLFILNIRDREQWIKSRLNHGHGEFAQRELRARNIQRLEELVDAWRKEWDDHLVAVKQFGREQPGRVIEFNLDSQTAEELVQKLPEYALNPGDFDDLGRSRGRSATGVLPKLKRWIAHVRPRFLGR